MRGQANAIAMMIVAGAAIALGLAIVAYFQGLLSVYGSEIQRDNFLNREMVLQVARLVAVDPYSNTVWILLRRLDNQSISFLLFAVAKNSTSSTVLNCSDIYYYVPSRDANGILCDSADLDCLNSVTYGTPTSPSNVLINLGQGWVDFSSYARSLGEIPPSAIPICLVPYHGGNQIVKIVLPYGTTALRLYLVSTWGRSFYILKELTIEVGR